MVIFLYGSDTYRSRLKLHEIVAQYEHLHPNSLNKREFDCFAADFEEVKQVFATTSMFEEKKLLILHNTFLNTQFENLEVPIKEILGRAQADIVVFFQAGEVKKTTPLFRFLSGCAKSQEFSLLRGGALALWIEQEFGRYGMRISRNALEVLMQGSEGDLWQLSNETKKLAAWKKCEGAASESDIALLCRPQIQTDIFSTIDALSRKEKKQAIFLLHTHIAKGDSPFYLFSMLLFQFRTVVEVSDLSERQVPYGAIVQQTKLHPFVVKKALAITKNFRMVELRKIYENLFALDLGLKTGRVEPEGVFDLFVASL